MSTEKKNRKRKKQAQPRSEITKGSKPERVRDSPARVELDYSWSTLCTEILRSHPDYPSWEILEELSKKGVKRLAPGIRSIIVKTRAEMGIETWRADRKVDPYLLIPVRMTRENYEKLAEGGKNVGLILEKILEKVINLH